MKKVKVVFAVLAAIAGIGGAYATTSASSSVVGTVYNWYTEQGGFLFRGTIHAGTAICAHTGTGEVCLRGTSPQGNVTVFD